MEVLFLLKLIHIILSKFLNLSIVWAMCHKTNITFLASCAKLWENYYFYCVFISNFVQKKIFISNECAISCKPGFELIRKWWKISWKRVISCKNASKRLRKNLLFRGYPSFHLTFLYWLQFNPSTDSTVNYTFSLAETKGAVTLASMWS